MATRPASEPEPLELLARMLVTGGYSIPCEGRGTGPRLQVEDIAGAVAMMGRGLPQVVVQAVATRGHARSATNMVDAALDHLLVQVQAQDLHRVRLVLQHAAEALIWPERRQPQGELARAAKMRRQDYGALRRAADAVLAEALQAGRAEFVSRLWRDRHAAP